MEIIHTILNISQISSNSHEGLTDLLQTSADFCRLPGVPKNHAKLTMSEKCIELNFCMFQNMFAVVPAARPDSTRYPYKKQKTRTVTVGRNRRNRNKWKTKLSKEKPSPDGRSTALAGRLCTALPATKKLATSV